MICNKVLLNIMRKSVIVLILLFLINCEKDINNPIIEPEPGIGKTTILIERGLVDYNSYNFPIVSLTYAKISISDIDTSLYFAMSESSPNDTIVILSHGVFNGELNTTGIPIADECLFIKAYFRNEDTSGTVLLYENLWNYSFIDSVIFEPYKLIGLSDTIRIGKQRYLSWKENYRIDTLKFNVYYKPNINIVYDRFSLSTMDFLYKNSAYDSVKYIAKFIVGIPSMTSEPNIVHYPYSTIELVYESSILKVISRLNYQVEYKLPTWKLNHVIDSLEICRNNWKSLSIHDYSIYQTIKSWYPWYGDTLKIAVYSDTINDIQKVPDLSTIDRSVWERYKTIDELFELAGLDSTRYELRVRYNSDYYYPEFLYYKLKPPIYTEGGFEYYTWNLEIRRLLVS